MLIRAALERYSEYTPTAQQAVGAAIVWLCDGMLNDAKHLPARHSYLVNLKCVKTMAEDMAERKLAAEEITETESYNAKLTGHTDV